MNVLALEQPVARPLLLAATVGEEGLGDLRGAKHLVSSVELAGFVAVEGMMLRSIKVGGIGSTRLRATHRGRGGHPWGDRGTPSAIHGLVQRTAALLHELALLQMTVNVGRVSGGTSINTIAAEAAIELDLRADRAEVLEDGARRAVAQLRDAPDGIEASVEQIGHRPSGCLPSDHPLLAAARRAREVAELPAATEGWSSTDANAAYARGIPAITVGVTTGGNTHRVDEYIDTAPVEQGLCAIEALAAQLVLPDGAHAST